MSNSIKKIPTIFSEGTYEDKDIKEFKKKNLVWKTRDIFAGQCEELFEINHPSLKSAPNYTQEKQKFVQECLSKKGPGDWIYFPWSGIFLHMIAGKEYALLRTNRNKNLITAEEQEILRNFTVGIAGLSVGSHTAVSLAYCGIADSMKLAEYDILDTTNLNRIRARVDQVGVSKIDSTVQQIYEVNPYAHFALFEKGLSEETLNEFVLGNPTPKIIFEIIDNFEMKIQLRVLARKVRIPVVSFANLGDRVLVDIERYDLDDSIPLFNGRAGNTPEEIINYPDITDADKHKYAVDLVGIENIPERAMESVREIGKTLVGRPQLMSTVSVSGSLGVYITKQIALGKPLPSGRTLVKFHDLLYY